MTFYFAMINAWSLAWETLYGDMDKEYPIIDTKVGAGNTAHEDDGLDYENSLYESSSGDDFMADVDDQRAHHFSINTSKKYQEDIGLKDLGEYVDTTYGGHYTSNDNNVQTLDIIESVGDAKSFCRSNAIKYLTRYDKKGQAKRDILKAAHYCLLLYYFDGHTNTN